MCALPPPYTPSCSSRCRHCKRLTTVAASVALNLQPFQKVFVYFYLRLYSFHTFRLRQITSSYVFSFVLLSIASIFTYRSFLCPFSHLCNVITICYETYSHSYAPATFFDFLFHCLCVYFIRFSHAALTKNGQKLVTCIKINQPIFCPTNTTFLFHFAQYPVGRNI